MKRTEGGNAIWESFEALVLHDGKEIKKKRRFGIEVWSGKYFFVITEQL